MHARPKGYSCVSLLTAFIFPKVIKNNNNNISGLGNTTYLTLNALVAVVIMLDCHEEVPISIPGPGDILCMAYIIFSM